MARTRYYLIGGLVGLFFSVLLAGGAVVVAHTILDESASNFGLVRKELAPILSTFPEAITRTEPVRLLFVGDVMLDRTVAARIRSAGDDRYPFFKIVDDERFTDADLQILNLEGPVTDRRRSPEKEIDFLFDPRFVKVLTDVGFDAASQANNHALDQGRVGADDSRARLLEGGLIAFGDEIRDDEVALATTTVRGRRLAFVGFNTVTSPMDEETAEATMKLARRSADTVIVFMHWGEEYRSRPLKKEEDRARWLIDRGADMIIGAHPHWVQSISLYKGKPIFYSLGNFVFDQDWSLETKQGLAVRAVVSDTELAFDLYPIQIDKSQPSFVAGEELAKRLRELAVVSDPSLTHQIQQGRVLFPLP